MLTHPSGLFSRDYISAVKGCCPLKFLHALGIDHRLVVHTPKNVRLRRNSRGSCHTTSPLSTTTVGDTQVRRLVSLCLGILGQILSISITAQNTDEPYLLTLS